MRVKFHQSVHLEGMDFKRGETHTVPDKVLNHPYFAKLAKTGLVSEAEEAPKSETVHERSKRLYDKLVEKKSPATAPQSQGQGDQADPVSDSPPAPPASPDPETDQAPPEEQDLSEDDSEFGAEEPSEEEPAEEEPAKKAESTNKKNKHKHGKNKGR